MSKFPKPTASRSSVPVGIVADGYNNFVASVEAETRRDVEASYVGRWAMLSRAERLQLRRQIENEIASRVTEIISGVDPAALF